MVRPRALKNVIGLTTFSRVAGAPQPLSVLLPYTSQLPLQTLQTTRMTVPDYAPEIENEVFAALNTKDPDRLLVMVVITAGVDETTANLLAPIIVDRDSRRAVQVVLAGSDLPVRAVMRRAF